MLLEEWLLLQPRGFFPTVLGETRQIWFHLNSCMSEELDIGPWGDFCTGGGCCVLGSVPWKAAGLCQCCCCAVLVLSLFPVTTCAAVPAPVPPCAWVLQCVPGF